MKQCEICKGTEGIVSFDFNEDGYPTLRNGTDIKLCPDCWEALMRSSLTVRK